MQDGVARHVSCLSNSEIELCSTGGQPYSVISILDTIEAIKPDVCTIALGQCASTATLLLVSCYSALLSFFLLCFLLRFQLRGAAPATAAVAQDCDNGESGVCSRWTDSEGYLCV